MKQKFKIGSQVFFSKYDDYESHDKDYIVFEDNPTMYKTFMNARGKGEDIFYFKFTNKENFIESELNHCKTTPMAVGKFLIPELTEWLGFTIEDLKKFSSVFENIDQRHKYEKAIYESYIENNGFFLTEKQRDKAYLLYKENKKK